MLLSRWRNKWKPRATHKHTQRRIKSSKIIQEHYMYCWNNSFQSQTQGAQRTSQKSFGSGRPLRSLSFLPTVAMPFLHAQQVGQPHTLHTLASPLKVLIIRGHVLFKDKYPTLLEIRPQLVFIQQSWRLEKGDSYREAHRPRLHSSSRELTGILHWDQSGLGVLSWFFFFPFFFFLLFLVTKQGQEMGNEMVHVEIYFH